MKPPDTDDLMPEDAYWDAMVLGEPALHAVDPALAQTIWRLQRADDAAASDLKSTATLDALLRDAWHETYGSRAESGKHLTLVPREDPPARIVTFNSDHRLRSWLVAASLAIVMLGAGLFGGIELHNRITNRSVQTVIPAGAGSWASAQEVMTVRLPAGILPTGSHLAISISPFTVEPGSNSYWRARGSGCCPSVKVEFVLTGVLTVTAQGDVTIQRANASAIETVPAGTEFDLGPGDAWISTLRIDNHSSNNGDVSVTLMSWNIADETLGSSADLAQPRWSGERWEQVFPATIPTGPTTVRLIHVEELVANAAFPAPAGAIQIGEPLGSPGKTTMLDNGSIMNMSESPLSFYVVRLEPAAPASESVSPTSSP